MSAPIQLYGPYYSRCHRVATGLKRALRTLALAAAVIVGVPMAAGLLYGFLLY